MSARRHHCSEREIIHVDVLRHILYGASASRSSHPGGVTQGPPKASSYLDEVGLCRWLVHDLPQRVSANDCLSIQ